MESSFRSFEQWQQGLADLRSALANSSVELRQRLNAHLKQLIDKIEVFAVGFDKPGEEDLAEYIQEVAAEVARDEMRSEWFNDFLRHVTERRMSKEGRFLMIYFRSGARRDIVPEGSIASGRGLEADEDGQVG